MSNIPSRLNALLPGWQALLAEHLGVTQQRISQRRTNIDPLMIVALTAMLEERAALLRELSDDIRSAEPKSQLKRPTNAEMLALAQQFHPGWHNTESFPVGFRAFMHAQGYGLDDIGYYKNS